MHKQQNPYHFFDTFCLRTPIYSLNFYKELFNKDEISIYELKNVWKDSVVREALFIASPELFYQLQNYFEQEGNINKEERLEQAFLKYIIRLATRCTPFGLFAGVSLGTFSNKTNIELKTINEFNRITRYDTNYIASLLNHLSKKEIIKNQLLFYPNSTLYRIANQCRYIEYELKNNKCSYSLEGVVNNSYLTKILLEAENGKTIMQLATSLLEKDIPFENASDFVVELIKNQILVSELELSVTGKETLQDLIERIQELNDTKKIVSNLKSLQNHLIVLDRKIGNKVEDYQKILDDITPIGDVFNKKYFFQTDLFVKTQLDNLSIKHVYTLKNILPLFNKLTPFEANKNLEAFKKVFFSRYETRQMPLSKVLDIDTGIGYIQNNGVSDTVSFLEGITLKEKKANNNDFGWTPIDDIIYQKLLESQKNKVYTIELTDKDFDKIDNDWTNIPDTLSAFVEIVKIKGKEHLIIRGFGANGGNLISRFSHGDKKMLKCITNISVVEQKMNPNKIIAEIVHLPNAKDGNILKRPHIRAYEIPYLAKSTLKKSQQIPIEDLFVSIENDTIILRSKKNNNKEVLPKLTNAHNYEVEALPIYHFLCDLQHQHEKRDFGYSPPRLLESHFFLPRITYKNAILSKAKWHLDKKSINFLLEAYKNDKLLLERIVNWKIASGIPKYVQLIEGDIALLIDLEHISSVRLLLNSIKNKEKCELEEFLFNEEAIVKRDKEQFTNEFVFTFYNKEKLNKTV